jgi:hypothetical protein
VPAGGYPGYPAQPAYVADSCLFGAASNWHLPEQDAHLLAVAAGFTEERFGARPLNDLIHRAGYWALVFLMITLAVTPLTRTLRELWGVLLSLTSGA